MAEKMDRIETCYQCRYGCEATGESLNWCHRENRSLGYMEVIPGWCRLPDWKETKKC